MNDRSIAELPLDASERKELHDLANKTHWAQGVLIDSALWNLEQAEAERDRLRVENENLATWVTYWRECNARNVKDIDHHRAGIRWAQGMCSDGEPVEAISAHLTKVLSTMPGGESPLLVDEQGAHGG